MVFINVIYQDQDIIVVDKPSGLATVRGEGVPTRETLLKEVRAITGQWVYPIHRLDRATSGLVIFALSQVHASILAKEFQERTVEKEYCALVRGVVKEPITIDRPLARLESDAVQEAVTLVEPLKFFELPWPSHKFSSSRYTLVKLRPLTGRTHQLRRHLSGISHPIVGDTKYGDGKHNQAFRSNFKVERLLLHAERLKITHPSNKAWLEFSSPFMSHSTQFWETLSSYQVEY